MSNKWVYIVIVIATFINLFTVQSCVRRVVMGGSCCREFNVDLMRYNILHAIALILFEPNTTTVYIDLLSFIRFCRIHRHRFPPFPFDRKTH